MELISAAGLASTAKYMAQTDNDVSGINSEIMFTMKEGFWPSAMLTFCDDGISFSIKGEFEINEFFQFIEHVKKMFQLKSHTDWIELGEHIKLNRPGVIDYALGKIIYHKRGV
jgi:hypothetical protein